MFPPHADVFDSYFLLTSKTVCGEFRLLQFREVQEQSMQHDDRFWHDEMPRWREGWQFSYIPGEMGRNGRGLSAGIEADGAVRLIGASCASAECKAAANLYAKLDVPAPLEARQAIHVRVGWLQ
jgi:hypothetical protein